MSLAPLLATVFQLIILIACAVTYYRAAEVDGVSPLWWAGASVVAYVITWRWLGAGTLGNLLGQAALLLVIGVVRAAMELCKPRE